LFLKATRKEASLRKVPIEVMTRVGEQVTIIVPADLTPLEVLGLANEALVKLGLHQARIVIGPDADSRKESL
jgi:hypothetical protein